MPGTAGIGGMDYPAEHTIELAGGGLLPQPSFFRSGTPTALAATDMGVALLDR